MPSSASTAGTIVYLTVGLQDGASYNYQYRAVAEPNVGTKTQTTAKCRKPSAVATSGYASGSCTPGQTFANNCTARIGLDDKEYRVFLGLDDPVKPDFLKWLKPTMNDYIKRVPAYPGVSSKANIPGESSIGFGRHSDDLSNSASDIRILFGHSDPPDSLIGKGGNVFASVTPQYEQRLEAKIKASSGNLSPTDITLLALQVTDGSYPLAVLTVHNLLKNHTVKAREALRLAGQAFGTKLYAKRCAEALVALQNANVVVGKLESLRQNPGVAKDKMGSWYHSFAVLAIGALTNHDGAFIAQQAEQTTKSWGGFAGEAKYDHEKNQLDLCWAQVTGIREVDALARSWLPSLSAIDSMVICWAAFGDKG